MSTLDLINISAEVVSFTDIDNKKLYTELVGLDERASYDPTSVKFEDRIIPYQEGSEFEKLIRKILDIGNEKGLSLLHYHALIHQPLEATDTHHHLNFSNNTTSLSWVYYVSVPKDSGKLIFMLDAYRLMPSYTYEPVEGMLVLFPSWLLHKVTKNMSNDVRISIAGDFGVSY